MPKSNRALLMAVVLCTELRGTLLVGWHTIYNTRLDFEIVYSVQVINYGILHMPRNLSHVTARR